MEASVTDLLHSPGEFLDVVRRGESVEIEEEEGRHVATLQPAPRTMSFGRIADMMEQMEPDPETAAAIEAEIRKARAGAAGRSTP
jgi:antitoxin (DNA-binding transcriptional repressor) of toxin-antitoxin stability system